MYIPASFAQNDPVRLWEAIERYPFGLLVSQGADGPTASHLPFLPEPSIGPAGTLVGHMARANPQWQSAAGASVLVVFSGPHAYVSPGWYDGGPAVPTWNYVAVHATGTLRLVEDRDELAGIVLRMVERFERDRRSPWRLDGSDPVVERLLPAIVGFRIELRSLEGAWKLSQNHSAARQAGVREGLEALGTDDAQDIARLMRGVNEENDS